MSQEMHTLSWIKDSSNSILIANFKMCDHRARIIGTDDNVGNRMFVQDLFNIYLSTLAHCTCIKWRDLIIVLICKNKRRCCHHILYQCSILIIDRVWIARYKIISYCTEHNRTIMMSEFAETIGDVLGSASGEFLHRIDTKSHTQRR